MTIIIPPKQIPQVWDIVKFVVATVDGITGDDLPKYLNKTLHDLLSSKAQCFIRLSEKREVMAVAITRIVADVITGEKALHISSVYSFSYNTLDQWIDASLPLKEYAAKNKCTKVTAYSGNPRAIEMIYAIGMKERFRGFVMEV